MKKGIISVLIIVLAVLLGNTMIVYGAPFLVGVGGTGTTTPSGILYGDNGATTHLNTVTVGSGCTFIAGTLSCAGTNTGTVSTSSSETATYVSFWDSTAGTPALLSGGNSGFTFNNTASRLSVTYASSTSMSSSATSTFSGITIPTGNQFQFIGYSATPQLYAGDSSTGLHFDGPGILSFHNSGTQTMLLTSLNRVGISSSTPGSLLSIGGNGTGINFFDNATSTFANGIKSLRLNTTATSTMAGIDLSSGCFAIAGTCLSTSGGTWPFTPSTNYGVTVQSTSTPIYFTTGMQASSTSYFSGLTVAPALTTKLIASLNQPQSTNDTGGYVQFNGGASGATPRGFLGFTHTGSGAVTIFGSELADAVAIRSEGSFQLGTAGNNIGLTMDTSQNVAIGNTSPTAQLQVNTKAATTGFLVGSSTTQFIVDSLGKVGIASSTPGSLLSIGGNLTGTNFYDNATTSKNGVGGYNIAGGCYAIGGTCLSTGGSGTVTSLIAGEGLLGGTITTSGTLYGQLGTSTLPVISNIPYFTSLGDTTHPAKFANVATSTNGTAGTIAAFDSAGRISPVYASTTAESFSQSLVGTRATFSGALSPLRSFVLGTATTTTWTATSTGAYVPYLTMPFAGTLRQTRCLASTTQAFLGVQTIINSTITTPSYFVASSTVGTEKFTGNNTFNAGDRIGAYFGTTTSDANAISVECTYDATETP